jgi:hypothetical protein
MVDDLFLPGALTYAHGQFPVILPNTALCEAKVDLAYDCAHDAPYPEYGLIQGVYISDWKVPVLANSLLHGGRLSLDKAAWRFACDHACVDPLEIAEVIS